MPVPDNPTDVEQLRSVRGALAQCADWVWELDAELRVCYVSDSIAAHLGHPVAAYLNKRFDQLPGWSVDTLSGFNQLERAFAARKPFRNVYVQIIHVDGRRLYAVHNATPIVDSSGRFCGYRGIALDVTDKVAADYTLERINRAVNHRVGQAYFHALVESLAKTLQADYAFVGRFEGEHKDAVRTLAVQAEGAEGQNFSYLLAGTPCREVSRVGVCVYPANIQDLFPQDALLQEMGVQSYAGTALSGSDGQLIGLIVVMKKAEMQQFNLVSKVIEMFADRAAAELERQLIEARLVHQAYSDSLTGLPNRPLAMDRLTHALKSAERAGEEVFVLYIDLDGFKNVNDSLGHDIGDQLLVEIAGRFSRTMRAGDTLARLGGDEFLVILSGAQTSAAEHCAQRLIDQLAEPIELAGKELVVGASVGITCFPGDGDSPELLLRNADTAMYRAKASGRNSFCYYEHEMNAHNQARIEMEAHLRHALQLDEFVLHYQPLVDICSGRIIGAEALVRWQSPKLGFVPPDRFISLAEDTGVIIALGEWIIHRAAADCAHWRRCFNPQFAIAVNVSPRQFRGRQLLDVLDAALTANSLPAQAIDLEVTESLLMENFEQAQDILTEAQKRGVHLSIDDFGTGYSSLSYLKHFPFDKLKIDRSFINDMCEDEGDAMLVSTVVSLAHNLGLRVVAEGVETPQQLSMLKRLQCELAQGYYFSKPLPAQAFEHLLSKGVFV